MSQKDRSRQRSKKLACILCAVCVLGCLLLAGCQEKAEDPAPGGIVYDDAAIEGGWEQMSQEEIEETLNETVSEGMIRISMNTTPVFEDGDAEGNLMIVNEDVNRYPQQVEIYRNDTKETIYESKAIPVGSKIEKAALDVHLEAGTYACTALFHSLDPETGSILGTAGAVITITINH